MHHALHVVGSGGLANPVDGSREVVPRDLVAIALLPAGLQQDADAEIEQPDVVAVLVEELQQIGGDGVGRENVRPHAQAVHQHHRPLAAALEAGQAQRHVVLGLEEQHFRRAGVEQALLRGRASGLK